MKKHTRIKKNGTVLQHHPMDSQLRIDSFF